VKTPDQGWLEKFHAGNRAVLEQCYRDCFHPVDRAVASIVSGADRETVVHEVFFRLLTSEELRRNFRGGSLSTWIGVVARNQAIDHVRRYRRETAVPPDVAAQMADRATEPADGAVAARLMVDQFRRDHLPSGLAGVFETRFVAQLSQREAAARLGIRRTTLAYQEIRVRALLRRFVLGRDS